MLAAGGRSKGKFLEIRVKQLLADPDVGHKYQRSDLALMSRIWFDDVNRIHYGGINQITALKFLDMLRNGELTKSESVTRCRRKLQAQYPELRDDAVYKGRKDKEKEMCEKLQYY
tara:strand:+ start:129 stop:473 length:345 start_codon:yes stop_codon:yes gene_type:complete